MALDIEPIESIKFENLSYSHGGGLELFSDVTFDFPTNCAAVITSVAGAGRSSILQLLAGLHQPSSGALVINEKNVTEMTFEEFLKIRLNIGYAFDLGGLIVNRTLEQNLMLPLMYHQILSPQEAKERVEFFLVSMGIYDQKDERPAHVSGGTRKAAVILRSIILKPDVLLLDDPTVGLSKDGTQLLVALMERLMDEGALKHCYIASHDDRFLSCFEPLTIQITKKQLAMRDMASEKKVANL